MKMKLSLMNTGCEVSVKDDGVLRCFDLESRKSYLRHTSWIAV